MFRKSVLLFFIVCSLNAYAGKDVSHATVTYVYQPDLAPTEFEFSSDKPNACGSSLYRVQSNDVDTANRKFAIILAAYTAGKNIAFHDKEVCAGSRSTVTWVRITE